MRFRANNGTDGKTEKRLQKGARKTKSKVLDGIPQGIIAVAHGVQQGAITQCEDTDALLDGSRARANIVQVMKSEDREKGNGVIVAIGACKRRA